MMTLPTPTAEQVRFHKSITIAFANVILQQDMAMRAAIFSRQLALFPKGNQI
jgi:hypothetical protein